MTEDAVGADDDAEGAEGPATIEDGLGQAFGAALRPQDDVEAEQWRASASQKLFGARAEAMRIGRLTVLGRVGSGGNGVVYAAYDPSLDRKVAVKLLTAEAEEGGGELEREAKLLAKLTHPNVVAVYDVGQHFGQVYVTMEFVDGGTLAEWMTQTRSWEQALDLFAQAGRGLAAAHAAGLVHGDFKPANVLVGTDGRVRVTDFGIARRIDPGASEHGSPGAGTPAYMAPEHYRGERLDAKADQWAFCVAFWEALYGARPFVADNLGGLAERILDAQPQLPSTAGSGVPAWLHEVLVHGLRKNPSDRHASMEALVDALERHPARRGRRRLAALAVGSGILVALALNAREPAAAPSVCGDLVERGTQLWNDEQRGAVRNAFRDSGLGYSAATWARLHPLLEGYAGRWRETASQACRDHPDEEVKLQRLLCLEWAAQDFSALVDVLSEADGEIIERAVQGAQGLPDPGTCLDAHAGSRQVVRPPDADALARVAEKVARARALGDTGKIRDGLVVAEDAAADAQRLAYRPAEARALFVLGSIQADLTGVGGQHEADTTLYAALMACEGDADLRARVLVALVRAHVRLGQLGLAEHYAAQAREAIELHPDRAHLEGGLLYALALADEAYERQEDAAEKYERAAELLDGRVPPDPWLAKVINGMGEMLFNAGRYGEAAPYYQRAVDLAVGAFGPEHPWVADARGNLAEVELLSGDLEAASAGFDEALRIRAAAYGETSVWVAHTRAHVGDLHLRRGEFDAAQREYRRVLEITGALREMTDPEHVSYVELDLGLTQLEPWARHGLALAHLERGEIAAAHGEAARAQHGNLRGEERHPDLAARLDVLGRVLLAEGDPEAALAELEAAAARVGSSFGPTNRYSAWPHYGIGLAHLARGEAARAVAPLERSLEIWAADAGASPHAVARAQWTLALALERGPRAVALERQARAVLADLPPEDPIAWLARHAAP